MDKRSVDWHGCMSAIVTPFDAEGRIDEAGFRANVELCIGYGATGLVVNGCTGEFWAQTLEERKRSAKLCVETARGRVPVIAGTGAITTQEVIELTEHAKRVGCDGAMILPPFFVKPNALDMIAHYQAVSDAVKLPIMLYNIPSCAVNDLTPELVDRLADIENVVAIKESSGNFTSFQKTLSLAGDRIHVFAGMAPFLGMAALYLGSPGYVDTQMNYWGEEAAEFYYAGAKGDIATGRRLQKKSRALHEQMLANGRNLYVSIKAAMNLFGRPGGYPRLPLRPLGEVELNQLRGALEKLGIKRLTLPLAAVAG